MSRRSILINKYTLRDINFRRLLPSPAVSCCLLCVLLVLLSPNIYNPSKFAPQPEPPSILRDESRSAKERIEDENVLRWLIKHGADVAAADLRTGRTVFSYACQYCTSAFVQELMSLVPRAHLDYEQDGKRPLLDTIHSVKLKVHTSTRDDRVPILQGLILRGATVDDKDWSWVYMGRKIKLVRRPVLAWAKAELAQNHDHRFFGLVLGCGVHGSRDVPPAQRSPLLKLRGDGHTNARALIWRCLSRRTRTELGRLRQAASVLQSEEDEYAMQVQEWDEEDPYGDLEGRHNPDSDSESDSEDDSFF